MYVSNIVFYVYNLLFDSKKNNECRKYGTVQNQELGLW